MKVEIDNVKEVREGELSQDGICSLKLPEYSGHRVKIVVLTQYTGTENLDVISKSVQRSPEGIEGKRYIRGQKRSRETVKEFIRTFSDQVTIKEKNQSWLTLDNNNKIRLASSVIYEGMDGDFLWYSFAYPEFQNLNEKKTWLALIIRDSHHMVYFKLSEISKELAQATELRQSNWLHIHVKFVKDTLIFHLKTGQEHQPIDVKFNKADHYIPWEQFSEIMRCEK